LLSLSELLVLFSGSSRTSRSWYVPRASRLEDDPSLETSGEILELHRQLQAKDNEIARVREGSDAAIARTLSSKPDDDQIAHLVDKCKRPAKLLEAI
jgi:hypothetical protein